jgi:hypothetical protein
MQEFLQDILLGPEPVPGCVKASVRWGGREDFRDSGFLFLTICRPID